MQLPSTLRQAVDAALEGVVPAELATASDALSRRYRSEIRDGRAHLSDDRTALAYLAARLPATYAAIRAAMAAIETLRPDFAPRSLLDFGAGPGTALWAARDAWPAIAEAMLVEQSVSIRTWGERFAEQAGAAVVWAGDLAAAKEADLVTVAYVLDELEPPDRGRLVSQLWKLTGEMLLIVEPGTPTGWRRVLEARAALIDAGAHLIAPCPHVAACPLIAPDWCHFSRRVARARSHRLAKGGEVPWEDEKFIYLAVSRHPVALPEARVIAPLRPGSGKVELKLCRCDGTAALRLFTRRDGEAFKAARRADWGDAL
ncbi:MAG TPA: small ribosomal subunit Rsm22 family protein [Candidatus Cybelea sp.]|nr:small ribosomal subunit Rsm22 family protein [Candidatus Cybelea sp.]